MLWQCFKERVYLIEFLGLILISLERIEEVVYLFGLLHDILTGEGQELHQLQHMLILIVLLVLSYLREHQTDILGSSLHSLVLFDIHIGAPLPICADLAHRPRSS